MKRFRIILIITSIAFIFSCSNTLKITETNFEEEVPTASNLVFTFNKDLVTPDQLNRWDDTEYIQFEPHINGRFKWTATNQLTFSPVSHFKPATTYTGRFTNPLISSEIKEQEITFHTPYVSLENAQGYWAFPTPQSNTPTAHITLNFNYKIDVQDLTPLLSLTAKGETVDFNAVGEGKSREITLVLHSFEMNESAIPVNIAIATGLKVGDNQTTSPVTGKADVPSPYDFEVNEITAFHDGEQGVINIVTSQTAVSENLKSFVEIVPEVDFQVNNEDDKIQIISTAFDVDSKYEINLKEDLRGVLGGILKYEYTELISFGTIEPQIRFTNRKGVYLSRYGNKNIGVNIINVEKVNVKIYKVYENNILDYLSQGYRNWDYSGNSGSYYQDYTPGRLGDMVFEEQYEVKDLPKNGNFNLLDFDFRDKLPQYDGLYLMEVRSDESYWLNARRVVSLTDIGLIAKEGQNSITVFANSLKTAEPLANVKLEFVARNNQLIGSATTDANGVATFKLPELPADNFKLNLITAKHGYDFTYLPMNRTNIETSRFEVGGRQSNTAGFDAFIYGDRDIYRPGETLNVSAIIRDNEWNVPGEIPVILKIRTPSGKELHTIRKTLNKHGAFEAQIPLPTTAMTGSYTAEVYTTNNVFLNSKDIQVEEFVPDRIKVDLELQNNEVRNGDDLVLNITATNFFGPPAANRNYEVQKNLKRKYFSPEAFSDYNFYIDDRPSYFDSDYTDGTTDENGQAQVSFNIPEEMRYMGVLKADLYASVFDETGRPVSRIASATIYTQDVFYGIGYLPYYNKTERPLEIPLIAVDKDGKALSGIEANVQVVKYEYRTVLTKSYGSNFRYESRREEVVLQDKTITLNGENTIFRFTPEESGEYVVRIMPPGINSTVENRFYAYGYGRTTYSSFEVDNEGTIDIELDKERYNTGEKAHVILKTPFSGKVLVTVESNDVLKHFYLETDKRAVSFDLDMIDAYVPNVYISATLFREHQVSDIPMTVAHGFAPVTVDNPRYQLPLEITARQNTRSKTTQTITVRSRPNSAVTVAVVDEGILQLTAYQNPEPYKFFYRKRGLEVKTYDVYPFLIPELVAQSSSTGGDGGNFGDRLNPVPNQRVKPVAFWSGLLETNSSGVATYDVDIPQFSGDVRIMAVAYNGRAFASEAINMKVADPLVISNALPRFFSPRDEVEMLLTLSNTTNQQTNASIRVDTEGPVETTGEATQTTVIPPNSEKQVLFKLAVKPAIGESKITVKVNALNEQFVHETEVPVRPASPLQKRSGSGSVPGGQTVNIDMQASDFIPSSVQNTLTVSTSPMVEFTDDLNYLLRYPYGCAEQVVSSAFPQLYYQDMVKSLFGTDAPSPSYHIRMAINKLKLMQIYNGALTYWTGQGEESWWATVYAAHFAVEAQKAGYDIDQSFLDAMFDYMKKQLRRKRTTTYYYNLTKKRTIAPKAVPYSLYVLALAGEPEISLMNYYKSHQDLLSLDGKYMLAAAYGLTGDRDKFRQLLPPAFEGEESVQVFDGSFYSPIRDEALALNVLLEVEPTNQQVGIMAKHLSDAMRKNPYLNTQERTFSFLALGKIAAQTNQSNVAAQINNSSGNSIARYDNGVLTLDDKQLSGNAVSISAEGDGNLYYFWESQGITADGSYLEEDSYLKVRKAFFTRSGQQVGSLRFEKNDLVVVRLSIQSLSSRSVENVVISDILPAGFEIENARITQVPQLNWIDNRSYPEYTDIRDDRINLFVTARPDVKYYYYLVRAVSAGKFQMGPVAADAMYNGEYHSYHGSGVVQISAK